MAVPPHSGAGIDTMAAAAAVAATPLAVRNVNGYWCRRAGSPAAAECRDSPSGIENVPPPLPPVPVVLVAAAPPSPPASPAHGWPTLRTPPSL